VTDRFSLIVARSPAGLARLNHCAAPFPGWTTHRPGQNVLLFAAPGARLLVWPRGIIVVDALPRTDTGKLQRFRLRDQVLQNRVLRDRVLQRGDNDT